MKIDKIERVNFTKLEQEVMDIVRKHCKGDDELSKDLFQLISSIDAERAKNEDIRALAFALANKL